MHSLSIHWKSSGRKPETLQNKLAIKIEVTRNAADKIRNYFRPVELVIPSSINKDTMASSLTI